MYYNENEPFAVKWLTELQKRGLIPIGGIDDRSITEVRPEDTSPTSHFFAGIGGWPLALKLAGWNPNVPVWTGSCPCQSLSKAGRKRGANDPRHLWPAWYDLIKESKPPVIFGEQTAGDFGREWISGVRADLEALGYAVGIADLPACAVGSPQKRQRIYWVADANGNQYRGWNVIQNSTRKPQEASGKGQSGASNWEDKIRERPVSISSNGGALSFPNNPWRLADRAYCHSINGGVEYRRIEPGTLPVATGIPNRVGRIRGYGNSIVPQLAAVFIRSFLEAESDEDNS